MTKDKSTISYHGKMLRFIQLQQGEEANLESSMSAQEKNTVVHSMVHFMGI